MDGLETVNGDEAAKNRVRKEQLRGGLIFRAEATREKRWREYIRIISYNYYAKEDMNGDTPVVNLIAARVRAIPPQLAFHQPVFDVKCVGQMPDPNSEVANAAMLAKVWSDEDAHSELQRQILDWAALGPGIMFTGFEQAKEGEVLDAKQKISGIPTVDEQNEQSGAKKAINAARKMLGLTGKKDDLPLDPSRGEKQITMDQRQRCYADRTSPLNFVIDPSAEAWADAGFMGRRLFLPPDRARLMFGDDTPPADSAGNVAIWQEGSTEDPFGDESNESNIKEDLPEEVYRVPVWEIWHMDTRETVYHDRKGDVIKVYPWKSPYPDYPFVPLLWDELIDCVWPEGLAASMHTLNNELNMIRKRELAEAGKAFGKYECDENIPTESEKQLLDGNDGGLVKVPTDMLGTTKPLERPAMPPDFWGLENRVKEDLNEVSRTAPGITGAKTPGNETATAASYAQAGSDATMAWRQLQVERAASEIGQRWLAYFFTVFDEPVMLRIINQDPNYIDPQTGEPVQVGTQIDFPYVGVEHAGYYKVGVASFSMASVAKDVERQQSMQVLQLLQDFPWFDTKAYGTAMLAQFPAVKDPSRFILDEEQAAVAEPQMAPEEIQAMVQQMIQQAMIQMPPQQPQMPPQMPPQQIPQDPGVGGPTMQGDLLAAILGGGVAPGTGVNGYPGPVPGTTGPPVGFPNGG